MFVITFVILNRGKGEREKQQDPRKATGTKPYHPLARTVGMSVSQRLRGCPQPAQLRFRGEKDSKEFLRNWLPENTSKCEILFWFLGKMSALE